MCNFKNQIQLLYSTLNFSILLNFRSQIRQSDREERVQDYLKNIRTVRKFFLYVDPTIINGDQTPLRRNGSSSEKTLSIAGYDTYVRGNYSLFREQVTAFTQVGSYQKVLVNPEFVFKGKGTRTVLNPPPGIKFQWAPKGSYRPQHMLKTIQNLSNRFNMFTLKKYAIYVLDDYSVLLILEIKEALLKCGYILVAIGGGSDWWYPGR